MIGFKDLENKYKLKTVKSNIAINKEQALEYASSPSAAAITASSSRIYLTMRIGFANFIIFSPQGYICRIVIFIARYA